jgi:hypothetical protein
MAVGSAAALLLFTDSSPVLQEPVQFSCEAVPEHAFGHFELLGPVGMPGHAASALRAKAEQTRSSSTAADTPLMSHYAEVDVS